jgi:negative regulator of sigma E activity
MTFMVWKYPERDDDRWIFVPAVDLVRRIAADDRRSSFVGSDFTHEDISGRAVNADNHVLLREEELEGRPALVVESVPHEPIDYIRQVSWIDKATFLPLREEYYDAQGELYRIFTADRIEEITVGEGPDATIYATVTQRTMANLKTGHRTEVAFTNTAYDIGLEGEDFTERSMRRPPRQWIR